MSDATGIWCLLLAHTQPHPLPFLPLDMRTNRGGFLLLPDPDLEFACLLKFVSFPHSIPGKSLFVPLPAGCCPEIPRDPDSGLFFLHSPGLEELVLSEMNSPSRTQTGDSSSISSFSYREILKEKETTAVPARVRNKFHLLRLEDSHFPLT